MLLTSLLLATSLTVANAVLICPSGFQLRGSTCYRYFAYKKSFEGAKSVCNTKGSKLAEPRNPAENEELLKILEEKSGRNLWLGLSDERSEGKFVWSSDDVALTWSFWSEGEPNNWRDKADCVVIVSRFAWSRKWDDVSCKKRSQFVCQVKPVNDTSLDCRHGNGEDYTGQVSTTVDGVTCKAWDDQFVLADGGGHNHCRNPDHDTRPWCYTDDITDTGNYWNYCDVPKC